MEPGYYWIRFSDEWIIGKYQDPFWELMGTDCFCKTSEIDEIGPFIPPYIPSERT